MTRHQAARRAVRRHRGPARTLLLTVITAVSVAMLAACTVGPSQRPALATFGTVPPTTAGPVASTPPLGPGGPGQRAEAIQWETCSDVESVDPTTRIAFVVDCASVSVDRPGQHIFGTQAVQVARARASGVAPDAPAVVVLLGQPGQNGRSRVASVAARLSPAVRNHFAVITIDLAGTGQSGAVDCLSGPDTRTLTSLGVDPTEPAAASALAGLSRSLTFECGDLAGPDLTQINSTAAADDLDALRAALGEPGLRLIGQGFGATLGAVYADRYPGRVGAAVLDAPSDPLADAATRAAAVAIAAERSLDALAASCPGFRGGCPLGADPRAQVVKAVSTLDAAGGARPGTGATNGGSVLLALLLRLGDPADWPALATALEAAAAGNGQPVEAMLRDALGLDEPGGWLNGVIIYGCNDTAQRISAQQMIAAIEKVRPQAPLFGPYTIGLVGLCTSWPAPEAALGAVKATDAAPILVAGAVHDPIAPYESVRSLAGQLGSATLISWQSGNHGSYPDSPCVTTAVDNYLLHAELPAVGSLCPP